MKESLLTLGKDALNSLRDLTPIVSVIVLFQVFVFRTPVSELLPLAYGGMLVIVGLTFFIFGLRVALFPVGEGLAQSLARKGSAFWLVAFAFALGFGTTIAEPALMAVTGEAAKVAAADAVIESSREAMDNYALLLRLTVALSVGTALVLGILRILFDWSLPLIIIGGYTLVAIVTLFAPKDIVGIAYDSGGVTTSTVTVPLVTALGVGLASAMKGRNPMTDGFGLIAFASLTPILFVLVFGVISQWN